MGQRNMVAFILTFQIVTVINLYLPCMLDQLQFCGLSFTVLSTELDSLFHPLLLLLLSRFSRVRLCATP